MVFAILFLGYGFTNDEGVGIFFPGLGGYYWSVE
jgi:hypothetical protein